MKTVTRTVGLACTSATLAIMAGLVLSDSPAVAQPPSAQTFEFEFTFNPDDLANPDRAQLVLDRLEATLRKECREAGPYRIAERNAMQACIDANLTTALKQIDHPQLAALVEGRARS